MDIELIDKLDNHVKYGIIYSRDDIKDCLELEAQEAQPNLKVNGFRPGKVPIDHIIRLYGEKLRIQAMNRKITFDIQGIIKNNNYVLASQPIYNFKPRQETGDTNFYVELELFLMPDLPRIDYDNIEIIKHQPSEEAFQEILDKNLLMFQIMTADYVEIKSEPSIESDRVFFTIDVSVDGQDIGALGGEMQAILGQEQAPPEIEAQLKGKQVGDEIVFTHDYPADATDLFAPFLAGTQTKYKIKIYKIERPVIKELDEEKIEKIGFRDFEHLFEVLEANTRSTLHSITFNKMRNDFLVQLKEIYKDVTIPNFIVQQEAHHIAMNEIAVTANVDVMAEITSGKIQINVTDSHRESAVRNVKIGLFIRDYVMQHKIEATDAEVKKELEKHFQELTRLNSINPEQTEKNYNDIALKAKTIVLETKVLNSVLERVKPKEVFLSKDEFF